MTQLILDVTGEKIVLPESKNGGYLASKDALSVDVQMVSGRMVREMRGNVWTISYQYGFFDTDEKNKLISALERGIHQPIACSFLPYTSSGELTTSDFFVTSFTKPRFMWSRDNSGEIVPLWADFSFELREVKPND